MDPKNDRFYIVKWPYVSISTVCHFGTQIDMGLGFFALVHKYSLVLNSKKIALVINTGGGKSEHRLNDAIALRRTTLINKIPYCTNMSTAQACLKGIRSLKTKPITATSLQDI